MLHVASMLYSGGVERWLVDLCPGGLSQNLLMDIAVLQKIDGLFARKAREMGINVFHCPADNPIAFVLNLRRLLREYGPYDAIHAHTHAFSAFALIAALLEGVPARVVHSHNVVSNSGFLRRSYLIFARGVIRSLATAGLAPSPEAIRDLLGSKWQDDRRWQVMPCGIDLAPFRARVEMEQSRAALGIPSDSLVLGAVGRLSPEKNHEFLVDVLGEILRRTSKAYLLIIGEGPLRECLQLKASNGGFGDRLILAGTRSDVPALLRTAVDVFVFPSPPPPRGNEALPIALIEAQAAGLPIVMSDGIPAAAVVVPELVTRLSSADSPLKWAEAVIERARSRGSGVGDHALAILEHSDFNRAQNISRLADLYRCTNGRAISHGQHSLISETPGIRVMPEE